MEILSGISELTEKPRRVVATIGNFDGVHLGHRDLIGRVIARARKANGTATVITFKPHPQVALRPEKKLELLNSYAEKLEILHSLGVDLVIEEPFSREFSNQTADDFVRTYLVERLGVTALFLGHDFAFGRDRKGSAELVKKVAGDEGIDVSQIPPLSFENMPVSSTRIRQTLDEGNIPLVNALLGRSFFVSGRVVKGQGRGRTIQVPTANLALEWRKLPRMGVYATKSYWRGQERKSVTNVGVSPTFRVDGEDPPVVVETHLLDHEGDVYGHELRVEFLKFLRPEKKFKGADELVAQIRIDISEARKLLA
jgi:riboflavin kinase/FMN adenylyltransferase